MESSAPRVIVLGEDDADRYREFCRHASGIMIYGTWQYRRFLMDLLGCKATYLAAEDGNGRLRAVMPIMSIDGPFGTVHNSLPFFGSYGGVIGERGIWEEVLWDALQKMADAPGVASTTVIVGPLGEEVAHFRHDLTDMRIGQVNDLRSAGTDDALLAIIDSSARRNIKAAERAGVTISIENDAFAELESIHRENMAAIGGRAKPTEFFQIVPKVFSQGVDYCLYVARLDGAVVAALLVMYAGEVADYFVPATRLDQRSIQPSAPLTFRAMRDAADRGYRLWNWGGTWLSQQGVLRFKRKWGALDRPYKYYIRVANPAVLKADKETLLQAYRDFYVVPFDHLQTQAN